MIRGRCDGELSYQRAGETGFDMLARLDVADVLQVLRVVLQTEVKESVGRFPQSQGAASEFGLQVIGEFAKHLALDVPVLQQARALRILLIRRARIVVVD